MARSQKSQQKHQAVDKAAAACLLGVPVLAVQRLAGGSNLFASSPGVSHSPAQLRTVASVGSESQTRAHAAGARKPRAGRSAAGIAAVTSLALACCAKRAERPQRALRSRVSCQARGGDAKAPLVVIAGPPAAGKGTQCDKIKEKFGYVHISTGDILRENVKKGTELGLKAKSYMDSGALVPSELIVDLVKDRLEQDDVKAQGCLLDGFPRAPDQAQAMADAGLEVQKFLVIKVPDDALVERGCGRRLDPETGDIYHLKFKPPPAEIVDRLVHRSDDQEDKIRARLQAYHSQIDGILPYFKDVAVEVDGTGKPDEVFTLVSAGLDGL